MTWIANTEVRVRIFASSVLLVRSYVYPHNNSNGSVGVLHSAVCGYPQVYRHQDVLQEVGVALCMLIHVFCATAFPHEGHSARVVLLRPATAIDRWAWLYASLLTVGFCTYMHIQDRGVAPND